MAQHVLRKALLLGAAAGVAAVAMKRRQKLDLRGKVVAITGGSHGLGLAMAREFAAAGADLALCARNAGDLKNARADLADRGANVLTVPCDVADHGQVDAFI